MLFPLLGKAQDTKATIFDEGTVVYKQMFMGGGILHTNGFGLLATFGRNKTAFKSAIYQVDLVTMRHPKEVRRLNDVFADDSRSFVYGKLNYLLMFRPTIGQRVISYDKLRTSGVAVGYTWRLGPSLALTRPVYLEILQEGTIFRNILVEKYDPDKHDIQDIYGRAGFMRGFNEMRVTPGGHAAFALNFEYDPRREGIKGIEVGAALDVFPQEIEIMAFAKNLQTFATLYVNLQIGSRFNR
jgi:hypothetical protein